jgi:hypothetical protein
MTRTLGLSDSTHDLYLGPDGNLAMLENEPAVSAACETASLAQLGEMVLATKSGIPNFQAVWTGVPNLAIWRQYLVDTLLGVDGVLAVSDLAVSQAGGVLSYRATVETTYGKTAIAGGIPASQ